MTERYKLVFSERADRQLAGLYSYIAEKSSEASANAYLGRILGHCQSLTLFPERGTQRDDLRPGLRTIGFERRATIVFSVNRTLQRVEIHGVFYGGQDFEQLLRDSDD